MSTLPMDYTCHPPTPPPPPPLRMLKVTHSYLRLMFLPSKSTSLIGRVLYQWTTHATRHPPPPPPLRMLKVTHSYLWLMFLPSKSTSLIGRALYQWTTHATPPPPPPPPTTPENVESYPQLSMADVFAV